MQKGITKARCAEIIWLGFSTSLFSRNLHGSWGQLGQVQWCCFTVFPSYKMYTSCIWLPFLYGDFISTFLQFLVVFWTVCERLSSFEVLLQHNPTTNHWETIGKRRHARRARAIYVSLILLPNRKSLRSPINLFQCLRGLLGQKNRLWKNICHVMRNEFTSKFTPPESPLCGLIAYPFSLHAEHRSKETSRHLLLSRANFSISFQV